MTEIAVTTNIKDAINKALDLSACDKTLREALETCSGTDSINITTLQKLSKLLRDQLHDGNAENMQSVAKHSYKS
jgi:cell division protein FtsX